MDHPSTSGGTDSSRYSSPDAKLILYADPETMKLMEYDETKLKHALNLVDYTLEEMIVEPWFQDNTELFDVLLNDKRSFVMCVYPPGSGKTTISRLLKYYLSTNGMPEEIREFLDDCQFQRSENEKFEKNRLYSKFRASASYVLVADFSEIKGRTYGQLELNYTMYMQECWMSCGLPKKSLDREFKNLETVAGSVWTSLLRLRSEIVLTKGNLYVILDSVDNMYNLIANLPSEESKQLYSEFTEGIAGIIHKGNRKIKTFCFGVSPYLIAEFQKYAISCYFLDNGEVGKYFSYSDTKIQKIIKDWKLKISVDQCKAVAAFQYNNNVLVNPYLSVSYLRSLKENGAHFEINLSPRSLWMKCIFTEDDLNILYNVFCKEMECTFSMSVSMHTMCTLPQESKHRQLYYPLFIFGGFLSCKEVIEEKDTYLLSSANESSKILLRRHLDSLLYRKFRITVSECQTFLCEYLTGNFHSVCKNLSVFLTALSSYIIKEEKPYHSFMAGILSPLMLDGYDVIFDKELGLIKPDTIIKKGDRIILEEYKHVIHPEYIPKKARLAVEGLQGDARSYRLKEFYAPLEKISKSVIVKLCREAVCDARLYQISNYATQLSSQYSNDVEINIIVFYLSQVILIHGKYLYETKQFSKYEIFASEGYFDNDDLKSILNVQ